MAAEAQADPQAGESPRSAGSGPTSAPRPFCQDAGLQLVLQADPQSVRHVLRVVLARLSGDLPDAAAGNLELVLAEALNNIVEHAYRDEGGRIELRIGAVPGGLLCRITDQGGAIPGGVLPDPARFTPGLPTADLPEGGFGWLMIRDLADDLHYRRDAGSNELQFRVALD